MVMEKARGTLYLLLILVSACASEENDGRLTFGYRLGRPFRIYELPSELREISGLQLLKDHKMACIQDEEGIIFIYDLEKSRIARRVRFGDNGDYEGIALAGNDLYVAESNGTLHFIKDFNIQADHVAAETVKTKFSEENNMEGICHDKENNRLLLALKDHPGTGLRDQKAVYAIDPETGKVTADPVFTIDIKELTDSLFQDRLGTFSHTLNKMITAGSSGDLFRPSGIGIHPFTRDIYLLGSESRILVILDATGKLKHVHSFPSSLFIQPEGITFADNGDLYISNEGRGRQANILTFTYVPKD